MKKILLLMPLVFLLIGCKGGEKVPLEPEMEPLDVTGEWSQTSRLKSDSCDIGFPGREENELAIIQFDPRVTIISDSSIAPLQTGTIDTATGEYTAEPVYLVTDAGRTKIYETGTFTETEYHGTRDLYLNYRVGTCRATYRLDAVKVEEPPPP